ncbi:MAG: AAA family ATPase [Desulfohalobiaceae bacterium]|nr:AAA family ATPase [Desulfohalobiaceae bacterium]
MKKLPLGISTLSKIINEGYAYVDKSHMVAKLADSGSYYFLSRPRRFGKSLFIDTLKEAFEGKRSLFKGLWLFWTISVIPESDETCGRGSRTCIPS